MSKCWAEWLNLVAAALSLIGSGVGTIALFLSPDPTGLTKAAAVTGGVIVVAGALAWVIAAAIALADCLESHDADKEEIRKLREAIKEAQNTLDAIEKKKQGGH